MGSRGFDTLDHRRPGSIPMTIPRHVQT
jgi:hypothetical protein